MGACFHDPVWKPAKGSTQNGRKAVALYNEAGKIVEHFCFWKEASKKRISAGGYHFRGQKAESCKNPYVLLVHAHVVVEPKRLVALKEATNLDKWLHIQVLSIFCKLHAVIPIHKPKRKASSSSSNNSGSGSKEEQEEQEEEQEQEEEPEDADWHRETKTFGDWMEELESGIIVAGQTNLSILDRNEFMGRISRWMTVKNSAPSVIQANKRRKKKKRTK